MNNHRNVNKPKLFIFLYLSLVVIVTIVALLVNARQKNLDDATDKIKQESTSKENGSGPKESSKVVMTDKDWQIVDVQGDSSKEPQTEVLHDGGIATSGTSITTDDVCEVGAPFNIVSYFDEDKDNRMSNAPIVCGLSNLNDDFSEKDIALIKSVLEDYYAQQNMSKIIYKLVYINENDYVERDGSVTSYNYTMTVNNTDSNKLQITYYSNISFAIRAGKSDNSLTTIYSKNWR